MTKLYQKHSSSKNVARSAKQSARGAKQAAGSTFSGTKSRTVARYSQVAAEIHGKDGETHPVLTDDERRAKVLEILNSLDAYAPPRVGDLDLSEPGRVRIKKGRERPMKFS